MHTEYRIEKPQLTLGFIPLTDCAPLVIALEKGLFDKYGLDVSLSKETSWANIRDKLAIGVLDAAHMLAPMVLAGGLGLNPLGRPTLTALSLDLNGNAVTVSESLYADLAACSPGATPAQSGAALKQVIAERRQRQQPPLVFATVFPFSMHNYLLRYWLAACGIDPDNDLQLIVIPPAQMVSHLRDGRIDGYCVGEPWNATAVREGIGRTLMTTFDIWNNAPEKVLGVNQEWAEQHPETHLALISALLEAMIWLDEPANRAEAVTLLARGEYVNAPADVVRMSLLGTYQFARNEFPRSCPDFNVFYRFAASFPWRSHALWQLTQMARWGQLGEACDLRRTAENVYRPDIYRVAASRLSLAQPAQDYKHEGGHATSWQLAADHDRLEMGTDTFFDGHLFDPATPVDYLCSLPGCDIDTHTGWRAINPPWSTDDRALLIAGEYQKPADVNLRS
jgi:nitrate/nitrite transport system substrate-binding protein